MKHLQDILDAKNYARLVRALGGTRIWVPKSGNLGHRDRKYFRKRNARVQKMRKRGKSMQAIAKSFDISLKRVYSILKEKGVVKKRFASLS